MRAFLIQGVREWPFFDSCSECPDYWVTFIELYRAVYRALSAIQNNGVSAFQGELCTGSIGPIVGMSA